MELIRFNQTQIEIKLNNGQKMTLTEDNQWLVLDSKIEAEHDILPSGTHQYIFEKAKK